MYHSSRFGTYCQAAPMETDGRASAWFDIPGLNLPDFWNLSPSNVSDNPFRGKIAASGNSSTVFKTDNANTIFSFFSKTNKNNLENNNQTDLNWLVKGSSKAKFYPVCENELVVRNGIGMSVPHRFQALTAMPEYKDQSFEEIRLIDYVSSPNQNMKSNTWKSLTTPDFVNTLLQNGFSTNHIAKEKNDDQTTAMFNENTFNLLQALLNNVKQRLDVSSISEEAKRTCEKLAHALVEYTEKTLENLTVVVLEDLLNNIKRREISSLAKPACSCSETNSLRGSTATRECVKTSKSRNTHFKKYNNVKNCKRNDFSSDGVDSQAEDVESAFEEQEHRCELTSKGKNGHRKAASVPTSCSKSVVCRTRPARHSISGSGRSPDKSTRSKSRHRKSHDENAYDDTDNDEYARSHESKHLNRDDHPKKGVTFKAKYNSESFRKKKKNPKKIEDFVLDECRTCEHLRALSMNEGSRREYKEKNLFARCKERAYQPTTEDKDNTNEDDCQRNDKITVSSSNVEEFNAAQNEAELQWYSDSSSV